MVIVNGGMVPPVGGVRGQGQGSNNGKPYELVDKDKEKFTYDPSGEASYPSSRLPDTGEVPKGADGSPISSAISVKADESAGKCSKIIYTHLWLDPAAASKCSKLEIAATIKTIKDAAKKLRMRCPCNVWQINGTGAEDVGCNMRVLLVWHVSKEGDGKPAGVKPMPIRIRCNPRSEGIPEPGGTMAGNTKAGDGDKDRGIDLSNPMTHNAGEVAEAVGVAAHELGHVLWGTDLPFDGSNHNDGETGNVPPLMASSSKGAFEKRQVSQKEACVLAARLGACGPDCCKAPASPVIRAKGGEEDLLYGSDYVLA